MMKRLTIDSSVIIASLLENEPRHGEALQIWGAVIAGEDVAIMPYSVFVEVVAAIRRRTGSRELATEVILNLPHVVIIFPPARNKLSRILISAIITINKGGLL